jgi:hypothetical protein
MDITQSSFHFSSQRLFVQNVEQQESLRVWTNGPRGGIPDHVAQNPGRKVGHDRVTLSPEAVHKIPSPPEKDASGLDPKTQILVSVIEALTGKKVELTDPADLQPQDEAVAAEEVAATAPASSEEAGDGQEAPGPALEYSFQRTYQEMERTSLEIQGEVVTAEGSSLAVDIELSMSRTFVQTQTASLRLGDPKLMDPLVINLEQSAAELTERRFQFDIDMDDSPEEIAFPTRGSGFLALDRNGDEVINDGSELFGPSTGHGFEELAAFDEDGDDWIDEADAVFDRLKIWSKDASGRDELFSLGRVGLGAIHLGRVDSLFHLHSANESLLGQVASTGVYLGNNGQAGTVQELDLSI